MSHPDSGCCARFVVIPHRVGGHFAHKEWIVPRRVDARLAEKGNSNSHGARPV